MFRLVRIKKSLGGNPVLTGVDLDVPDSGVTFVAGASGAGKTVLLRCCVGLMRPDAGEVWVEGCRVDDWPERRLVSVRRSFPYVAQGSGLLDWMTLRENVELPLRKGLRLGAAGAGRRAQAALERVAAGDLSRRYPGEVGPGVHKRVAIARALALEPKGILYDEPTSGLDPVSARRIGELIGELSRAGVGALVVSHDLAAIRSCADRVALLSQGKIAFCGTPAAFFDQATAEAALFFGEARALG